MDLLVWILSGVVAFVFLAHGAAFIAQPEQVREQIADGPISLRSFRLLGIAEVVAAVMIVLLPALGVGEPLAIAAAIGLAVVMVLAISLHLRRGEGGGAVFTLVLLAALGAIIVERLTA